jgi:hypothetical protein
MNNGFKVGMALAGAAAIAVGGTAFTASNTMTADPVMGNGIQNVTGVVTTNTAYTYSQAGALLELDRVVYTVDEMDDFANVTATITVAGTESFATPVTEACVVTNATTITCDDGGELAGWLVEDIDSLALAVKQSSTS